MNLFRQNADILKILKFKLLATYVFLILQYLAEISRFWINATEPPFISLNNSLIRGYSLSRMRLYLLLLLIFLVPILLKNLLHRREQIDE